MHTLFRITTAKEDVPDWATPQMDELYNDYVKTGSPPFKAAFQVYYNSSHRVGMRWYWTEVVYKPVASQNATGSTDALKTNAVTTSQMQTETESYQFTMEMLVNLDMDESKTVAEFLERVQV